MLYLFSQKQASMAFPVPGLDQPLPEASGSAGRLGGVEAARHRGGRRRGQRHRGRHPPPLPNLKNWLELFQIYLIISLFR